MSDRETAFYLSGYLLPFGFIALVGLAVSLVLKGNRPDKKFVWWPTLVALVLVFFGLIGSFARTASGEPPANHLVQVHNDGPRASPIPIYDNEKLTLFNEGLVKSIKDEYLAQGISDTEIPEISVSSRYIERANALTLRNDISFKGKLGIVKTSGVAGGNYRTIDCHAQVGVTLLYENSACDRKIREVFGAEKADQGAKH